MHILALTYMRWGMYGFMTVKTTNWLYVCMYVCMYVCTCTHTYNYMYTIHTHKFSALRNTAACRQDFFMVLIIDDGWVFSCAYTYMHIHTHKLSLHMFYIDTYKHTYTQLQCTCVHGCMWTRLLYGTDNRRCVNVFVYTYSHAHTYTRIECTCTHGFTFLWYW
jgi:hypothetical protein